MVESSQRFTSDGLRISSSEISRLEKELKELKERYDSLKIRQLTKTGSENDAAKQKADMTTLEQLKKNRKQNKRKQQYCSELKTGVASALRLSLGCLLEFSRLPYLI